MKLLSIISFLSIISARANMNVSIETSSPTLVQTLDPQRTLKLLIITAENPEKEDFAMYVSRRYQGGTKIAVNDVKSGTEYGDWDNSELADFNFEIVYVGCGRTGNETTIIDDEPVIVESTTGDLDCSMDAATHYLHDHDLIGIMVPEMDIIAPSVLALAYLNRIPVFTIDTPDTDLPFANSLSMSPTNDREIDAMISIVKHNGWKKVGLVYLESFNSFGFAFGKKASAEGIQLHKYVVSNNLVIDDVIEQMKNDNIKIIIFHAASSGSHYAFLAITNFVDSSHVILTTSAFNQAYVVRHDACLECLQGVTTILEVFNDNKDIEDYDKKLITMNENGEFGVDVLYSYTGVSDIEYKLYDAWMTIFNHYIPVADRLRNGESVSSVTKDLERIGSDVAINGLSSFMSYDDSGNVVKDYHELNFQKQSKDQVVTGIYSSKTETFTKMSDTIFADGTTTIPPDKDPDIVRTITNGNMIGSSIIFAISSLCAMTMIAIVLTKRNDAIIKGHGYSFIISSIVGALLASFATLFVGILETNVVRCHLENVMFGIAFALLFGSLLLKNWRVRKIMTSIDLIVVINAKYLFVKLFIMLIPEIVVFITKLALSNQSLDLIHVDGTYNEYRYACQGDGDNSWFVINAYRLLIAGSCTYFAIKTLSFPAEFQESVYVIYFTLWTIPSAVCVAVILSLIEDDIDASYLIKYLFVNIGTILYTLCLVIPILKASNMKKKSDRNGTTRGSTQASRRFGGGFGSGYAGRSAGLSNDSKPSTGASEGAKESGSDAKDVQMVSTRQTSISSLSSSQEDSSENTADTISVSIDANVTDADQILSQV